MRPVRRAPYDLGALDEAYAVSAMHDLGCACDVEGLEEYLPGSAGKGAVIGAAVGNVIPIPGVGAALGGAVGAAAGAAMDLIKGVGGNHCKVDGREVPCPKCGAFDVKCIQAGLIALQKEAIAAKRPKGPAPVKRPAAPVVRAPVKRPPPPPPPRQAPPPHVEMARISQPLTPAPAPHAEAHSAAVPIAIGAAALLAAGGGAFWWWKNKRDT